MLEVSKLTKIFKSGKNKTIALDNVSFKLPDKGCAFIIGKSGSGKTTLLSLIGGLDDVTSGEIIYHGNKLSDFKHSEFDVYRNNEVGFIFQDYHLLEELTIFDNIKMMLDFKNIKDDNRIYEALDAVGLKGYENRYPKELSGGEKQRVAIARIIVKDPLIILADEPTGNLDQKTSKQILTLLKIISKNKLVLIVSHNKYDAYEYGDYIFKLQEGKIVEKYMKKDEVISNFHIDSNTLYISKNRHINENEVDKIINDLKSHKITDIKQSKSNFIAYDENIKGNDLIFKKKKNHISFFNSLKYSFKFFKKGLLKSLVMSFLFSVVISVATLCGNIANINKNNIRLNFLEKTGLVDYKIGKNDFFEFVEDDLLNEVKETCKPSQDYLGYHIIGPSPRVAFKKFDEFMLNSATNSLIYRIDNDFLLRHFSINGQVEYIFKRDIPYPDGFYVTDAFLDNTYGKHLSKEDINDIIKNNYNKNGIFFKVNGVIKTDIKDRYKDLLSKIDEFTFDSSKNLSQNYKNMFSEYVDEMYLYHNGLYTFNDNFYQDLMENSNMLFLGIPAVTYKNVHIELKNQFNYADKYGYKLNKDEMILNESSYRLLTHDKTPFDSCNPYYLKDPFEICVDFYNSYDSRLVNKLVSKTFKVVAVSSYGTWANSDDLMSICKHFYKPSGLIVENVNDYKTLTKINEKYDTSFLMMDERYIDKIDTLVSSLKDFFIFILLILIFVILLGIFLYFNKSFSNNLFEIGVMKSLGARDKDVINTMLVNFIVVLLITLILFSIMEIPLILFSNKVLFDGISRVSGFSNFNSNIQILFADPIMMLAANLIIAAVFIFAFMVQFIRIRKLKPVNIIKAKE